MKMLYGHIVMWNVKMQEIHDKSSDKIDKPLPYKDLNKKSDEDFTYFWLINTNYNWIN
jgi:hypothetical protein